MTGRCLQSRTLPRRVLLALFPAAPPATRTARAVLLAGLYRLAGGLEAAERRNR